MKRYLFFLGLLLGGGALTACESYLDVNTDPNNPVSSTPNFLLPGIISQGIQTQMFTSLTTTYLSEYTVRKSPPGNSTDQFYLTNANSTNTFNNNFYYSAGNVPTMTAVAEAEGSPYYVGAGKIITAMDLAHTTDMIGDIPYTEAFKGAANYTPKYDSQEQIYATVNQLLDEGITLMQAPASQEFRPFYSTSPSISGDILYQGNAGRWIRFANSLKARQLNHLTRKGNNAQQVLDLVDKGFTSSDDDAQIQLQTAIAPLTNTTNIFGPTRANYGTSTFSSNIIKYLNGNIPGAAFPGVVDPRFTIMATSSSTGSDPGVPVPDATRALLVNNVTDFYSGWYARDLGTFEVITYHELKFIEAEAAFRAGNKTRALTAYKAGIRAHMTKIGKGGTNGTPPVTFPVLTTAQIDAYLSSAAVAQTADQLTMKNIMEQKYIAMFLNPESWTDLRRFDYDPTIYPNLRYPASANPELGGKWPRRMLPGATEVMYNPQATTKLFSDVGATSNGDYVTKPLWWDQP
ncbi:SusD/RagB family nutrient-binding outer membrane lipoprotein [Hymenobacter cavernae]|uniref:SusD/RagB family nutrient-binding outer membrane lipoprotein n=1 Tax=Hymenobacter cavernae TaxID=2044852 RepID=A0ABQ1TH22_9BACT|nr:SusD/RagB family nutrient-binding outer membrane lipoprotein [Hymenobacter cavernae]GGE93753.1 hypothetical protein GCM10011383_00570 [Hymenobacter cavernae]